jgi:hypothetical protein
MFGNRNQQSTSGTLVPMWSWKSLLLDLEQDGPRISSLVYSGSLSNRDNYAAVRRLEFSSKGSVSLLWEYQFPSQFLSDDSYGRLEDQLILPGEQGGIISVDIKSGEKRWEVNYTTKLRGKIRSKEEQLLLVFQDQSWAKVDRHTGAVLESGRVTNDDQLSVITSSYKSILPESFKNKVNDGGSQIELESDHLEVSSVGRRDNVSPKAGKYPLEDWKVEKHIGIVEQKVVVWLENKWDDKKHLALGILALPSLEPRRLLKFGVGGWSTDCDAMFEINGLLWVRTETLKTETSRWTDTMYVAFLVDVKNESFAAYFTERQDCIFWYQNEPYWRGKL